MKSWIYLLLLLGLTGCSGPDGHRRMFEVMSFLGSQMTDGEEPPPEPDVQGSR